MTTPLDDAIDHLRALLSTLECAREGKAVYRVPVRFQSALDGEWEYGGYLHTRALDANHARLIIASEERKRMPYYEIVGEPEVMRPVPIIALSVLDQIAALPT